MTNNVVGSVKLIDCMGSDLTVVNSARVSFAKESTFEVEDQLSANDTRLVNYLARHQHWSPFAHVQLQFHVKAPIFVARQLVKHQVGLVWNEVSRRYVDAEPEFFLPEHWRRRAENAKQGSSAEHVDTVTWFDRVSGQRWVMEPNAVLYSHMDNVLALYNDMLRSGVCPEQARMILPLSTMTEWYWTGSLAAFARVVRLRTDSHAQAETAEIARMISAECSKVAPLSWAALNA